MNDLILMTQEEARDKTDRIKSNISETRYLLLEMQDRQGWKALEYDSWRAYGQAEFGYSKSRIYQLAEAARVEKNISTKVEKQTIPETHLRPLTKLESPEQQQEAWQKVVETAPEGKVTAYHVSKVVSEIRTDTTKKEVKRKSAKARRFLDKASMVDEDVKKAFDAFYREIQRARLDHWKDTSKEALLRLIELAKDLVEVK